MKKIVLLSMVALLTTGCASQSAFVGKPAPGSVFSKLEPGMSMQHVDDITQHAKLIPECRIVMMDDNPILGFIKSGAGLGHKYYECSYKREGELFFDMDAYGYGELNPLTKIFVDKNNTGYLKKETPTDPKIKF